MSTNQDADNEVGADPGRERARGLTELLLRSGERKPKPGCPPAPLEYEDVDMHICGSCFELRKPRQKGNQLATVRCLCDRERGIDEELRPWKPDLDSLYRLCWCCGGAVIKGLSRFSLHVCQPCFVEIQEISGYLGRRIAPIGRHSIHHGISLRTDPPPVRQDLVDMAAGLNGMVSSTRAAQEHQRARTAELVRRFGFFGQQRVDLWEYLARVMAAEARREGLESLAKYSSDRGAWESESPELRESVLV